MPTLPPLDLTLEQHFSLHQLALQYKGQDVETLRDLLLNAITDLMVKDNQIKTLLKP